MKVRDWDIRGRRVKLDLTGKQVVELFELLAVVDRDAEKEARDYCALLATQLEQQHFNVHDEARRLYALEQRRRGDT